MLLLDEEPLTPDHVHGQRRLLEARRVDGDVSGFLHGLMMHLVVLRTIRLQLSQCLQVHLQTGIKSDQSSHHSVCRQAASWRPGH